MGSRGVGIQGVVGSRDGWGSVGSRVKGGGGIQGSGDAQGG